VTGRLTSRFTKAFDYARTHHAADVRKGTTIPYVAHLLAVSALVLENGGDETAAVAALLHDVVEDRGGERALDDIRRRFGADVAAIVKGCSDTTATVKEDWELRKNRYLEHLEAAPADVLLVSAADKLHNARSILADLGDLGEQLWTRFTRGVADWYYGALCDVFLRRFPGRLADELDRTVRAINGLVDPDDRIEALGHAFTLWSFDASADTGAIVDWPGCPLVITKAPDGMLVRADVDSVCVADYEPGDDEGLDTFIDVSLGDLRLEYHDGTDVAWLVAADDGHLREACEKVARLAPTVSRALSEHDVMLHPPTTTYAERVAHGPWFTPSTGAP
jgi:hypothetical protein